MSEQSHGELVKKGKQLALFLMLIMGTLLHGISVADVYRPALAKVISLMMALVR